MLGISLTLHITGWPTAGSTANATEAKNLEAPRWFQPLAKESATFKLSIRSATAFYDDEDPKADEAGMVRATSETEATCTIKKVEASADSIASMVECVAQEEPAMAIPFHRTFVLTKTGFYTHYEIPKFSSGEPVDATLYTKVPFGAVTLETVDEMCTRTVKNDKGTWCMSLECNGGDSAGDTFCFDDDGPVRANTYFAGGADMELDATVVKAATETPKVETTNPKVSETDPTDPSTYSGLSGDSADYFRPMFSADYTAKFKGRVDMDGEFSTKDVSCVTTVVKTSKEWSAAKVACTSDGKPASSPLDGVFIAKDGKLYQAWAFPGEEGVDISALEPVFGAEPKASTSKDDYCEHTVTVKDDVWCKTSACSGADLAGHVLCAKKNVGLVKGSSWFDGGHHEESEYELVP